MKLEPASRYSQSELAEIFTAGYEGYFTPFVLDEAGFRFMSTTFDDDLDASRIAVVGGEAAGICKLAIRGERGWVGGMGVAPPHRGKGIGEALMRTVLEEARARGLREVWLEVLFPNEPAIRLYEKLDFERVRVLEVWTLDGFDSREEGAVPVPLEQAQERIRRDRREREPWQRADESVAHLENVEALENDHGAVLYRRTDDRISLLQAVADDEGAARNLLQSLPPEATSLQWVNGPSGDPLNAAIESLGGTLAWRQHEMVLRL
jgi:ribosomal protein S18 acetylase RimI-like enzyme